MEDGQEKVSSIDIKKSTATDKAQEAVNALYNFRDHYFESHSLDQAITKNKDVEEELKKVLETLDSLQDEVSNKAVYLMLRGRALNVLPGHSAEAQEVLSKAVKLDPKLAEAWVNLGECYWKNKEIELAKNCFLGALNHGKDKAALRNLSMVLRQVGTDNKERIKNIEESAAKAKEAVQLDIKDGLSWFILGNAYLSQFFATTQSPKVLKQCLSAYQQAERDTVTCCNPDLHFNRATAYKYQEEYELALIGFARAAALDPLWAEPKQEETMLVNFLDKLHTLVQAKGKVRPKKLAHYIHDIKDTDLGPYDGGSYTTHRGDTIVLESVYLRDLHVEENPERVILGKVVSAVVHQHPVPYAFCMMDKTETCCAVTIYNISSGYGLNVGDSVAIPEPYVKVVDVQYGGKIYKYKSIRVESPMALVVNGRKLGVDKQAPSVLAVSAMSE